MDLVGACTGGDMWASVQYLYHEVVYSTTAEYLQTLPQTVQGIIGEHWSSRLCVRHFILFTLQLSSNWRHPYKTKKFSTQHCYLPEGPST